MLHLAFDTELEEIIERYNHKMSAFQRRHLDFPQKLEDLLGRDDHDLVHFLRTPVVLQNDEVKRLQEVL